MSNDIYQKIISSRFFYESCDHSKISIDKVENKSFYDNIIKIEDSNISLDILFEEYDINREKIVLEAHEDAKLKNKLLNLVFNCQNFEQIKLSDILENVSNKFKNENKIVIKKDTPIYVFKFSFSNPVLIPKIFKSFSIDFSSSNGTLKEIYDNEIKTFKNLFENLCGLVFNGGNCFIMLLNSEKLNESVIVHEIYHILQFSSNKKINLNKIEDLEISSLKLSKKDIQYLYDPYEFETHIKVDLIDQLTEIYWKFYNKMSKEGFIETFITQCYQNPHTIYKNEIIDKILYKNVKHDDLTSIRLFLSTFLIKDKTFNELAQKWLKESFKN